MMLLVWLLLLIENSDAKLRMLAVFSDDNYLNMVKTYNKTLAALGAEETSQRQVEGVLLSVPKDGRDVVEFLCERIELFKPEVFLLFAAEVLPLAESLGRRLDIPVVTADHLRFEAQEANSLLTNLVIEPKHLVTAVQKFTLFNKWHNVVFLLDEFQKARRIEKELRKNMLNNTTVTFLQREEIATVLSNIKRNPVDVIVYCCDPYLLLDVFRVAAATRANFNWLLLDEAITRQRHLLNEFPMGLLGIRQVPLRSNKQTFRTSLLLLNEVAKVVSKPGSLGNVSCWRGGSRKRMEYSEILKRTLTQQLNSNLNGRLTFDGGGTRPIQPSFEILNLVPKDLNRAKRDKSISGVETKLGLPVSEKANLPLKEIHNGNKRLRVGMTQNDWGRGLVSALSLLPEEQDGKVTTRGADGDSGVPTHTSERPKRSLTFSTEENAQVGTSSWWVEPEFLSGELRDVDRQFDLDKDAAEGIMGGQIRTSERSIPSLAPDIETTVEAGSSPMWAGTDAQEERPRYVEKRFDREGEDNLSPPRPLVYHPTIFFPDEMSRWNLIHPESDWRELTNSSFVSDHEMDGGQFEGQVLQEAGDKSYDELTYEADLDAKGTKPIPHYFRGNRSRIDGEAKQFWNAVGNITSKVNLDVVVWPDGTVAGPKPSKRVLTVAVALLAPFVMQDAPIRSNKCLDGVECQRISGSAEGLSATGETTCCYGLSIDLMTTLAKELDFECQVYLLPDDDSRWDRVIAEIQHGAAHLSFAPLSVSSPRSIAIDFSVPYFYSGLSFLASIDNDDVSLLAFLKPFSAELWIGIFISLNLTAIVVATYEWLSPFGLNPWGRQRTKNFSLASALWVMWGLLFSHLVQFKAPKSWPNKFLINVWGGFSVIFLASYTANIAALFAGIFAHGPVTNFQDDNLLRRRIGTTNSSGAEDYAFKTNRKLWEHMQKYRIGSFEEGVERLRNGSLDMIVGESPIIDYLRSTDVGCTLHTVGEIISGDTFAIGMKKGLNIKPSIDSAILRLSASGYLDNLRAKWYNTLPCFHLPADTYKPQALDVSSVVGVFILLGFGILAGFVILILEHLVYRHALPRLRISDMGAIWRSPNVMFFSQKLYRFINCVDLLPPHHAALELVHSLRQGHITSLFQKSVKRKENEQRRRRRSKAQFFEMIQEIKRFQQEERRLAVEEQETSFAPTVPIHDFNPFALGKTVSQSTSHCLQEETPSPWPEEIAVPKEHLKEAEPHLFPDKDVCFSPVVALSSTNSSLIAAPESPGVRRDSEHESASEESDAETLFSYSLVDKATLKRLTKEDLYLLWQAAESELKSQVEKLRLQKIALQNEMRVYKGVANLE